MTPGIQSSFFLLLLLPVFTVSTDSGHTNSSPSRETETLSTQSHTPSSLTERTAFNSSLEDPSTKYFQELQRNISELFLQIYKEKDFLGISYMEFRPGSVVAESTLAFQEGSISVQDVENQLLQHLTAAAKYNLNITGISVKSVSIPSSAQSGSGVPGWGIALLVLVCVLVTLAIIYLIALAVCQCRRKNYGQLDIFPTRDAYHPMSEYPTYHTHGRYVPPGSSHRSPYEEVSSGNGGSSLSYTNPAVAATSANL
ncbi:mucin-1 isoform X4 [Eulemur rufifrons]|uniref:mucin-1 isoform X4 n=1 Tax=Eulemur rufifrons TaxID=859984 RepID=UPI003742D430